MIIREGAVENAWYRAAGVWFIALFVFSCVVGAALDYYNYPLDFLWWILIAMPVGSITLWMCGKVFGSPKRVLVFVSVFGLFGILPLVLTTLSPMLFLIFFDMKSFNEILVFSSVYVVFSIVWTVIELRRIRKSVREKRFIEREFHVQKDHISLTRNPKTNIDRPRIRQGSFLDKAGTWLFPKLMLLVPIGYPLQRMLSDAGGFSAILLFTTILTVPLTIHAFGRIACGVYLWIYKVLELETVHGKPVVFE